MSENLCSVVRTAERAKANASRAVQHGACVCDREEVVGGDREGAVSRSTGEAGGGGWGPLGGAMLNYRGPPGAKIAEGGRAGGFETLQGGS